MEVSMRRVVRIGSIVSTVALILLVAGCSSAPRRETRSITIAETSGGNGVTVAVSEGLARSLVEGAIGTKLDCSSDLEPEFESLLRELDRGSRATLRDGDTIVRARRRGHSLRLDIRTGDHEGSIEALLPWAFAECLLGRSTTLGDRSFPIRLTVTGEGGGVFEFTIG
jgi:hypothetical protein